ncbi:VWA domain-containing protein [Sphingobacterium sp. DN00404]|uniref:VWA domain-containing protein n=1 Tax=Sphingobacterium micropteri TaxID=2763501 RepID=A0ABR7YRH7_9SPHI|nr:VWA domain-containing protein [Sphingobacterium micropteri]MBD1433915.1 VWA domain-containing protein [Sphingobacterium micropteri]
MKKLYPILFVACFLVALSAQAQTSDVIKFYIAYDQSGSIGNHDHTANLKNMVNRLLNINPNAKNLTSDVVFEFYGYGSALDTLTFNPTKDNNNKLNDFLNKTKGSRSQQFTYMHTALDSIREKISKESSNQTAGVFVFTDGLLKAGDIDTVTVPQTFDTADTRTVTIDNVADYDNYLTRLIQAIQVRTGNNLYVVQTSIEYDNDISQLKELRGPKMVDENFASSSHFFWIKSNENSFETEAVQSAFDKFVQNATVSMLSAVMPDKLNERVEVALMIQQMKSMYSLTDVLKEDGKEPKNIIEYLSEVKNGKDSLNEEVINDLIAVFKILAKEKVTSNDSQEIRELVDKLQKHSEQLVEISAKIQAKAISDTEEQNKTISVTNFSNTFLNKAFTSPNHISLTETTKQQATLNLEEDLILGFTDYIIDRAKQEAVYAFFENMHEHIFADIDCDDEAENYFCFFKDVLFAEVGGLMDDRHDFPDMAMLKAAFQKDLKRMPTSLQHYFGEESTKAASEGIYTLISFMYLFDELMETGSLETAFSKLNNWIGQDKRRFFNIDREEDKFSIQQALSFTTQLISHLQKHDLASVYHDAEALETLSTLLIHFSIEKDLVGEINMQKATDNVKKVYRSYRLAEQQIDKLQKLMNTPPQSDYQGYRVYQRELFNDVIHQVSELLLVGDEILYNLKLTQVAEDESMSSYNYKMQINKLTRTAQNSVDTWFMLKEGAYVQAMLFIAPELMKIMQSHEDYFDDRTINMANNLLYIAGEVSVAQNSSDVKAIIANYAMPVASYKTKRNTSQSWMLTTYAGVGGVWYPSGGGKNFIPVILAPTGFEYTWSVRGKKSLSAMVSIIDIGNIIQYRLSDSAADSTKINFNRIFSPGVHLSYGISSKLPLALTAGYQFNPQRVSVGVCLDLPLITLWKK